MSDPVPTMPSPRRGNALLIVSLCLNAALIGMIAFGIANAIRFRNRMHLPGPLAPQALMQEASPAERAKIQAIIDGHLPRFRQLKHDSMEARTSAFRVFADPAFNAAAFESALERVHQADNAFEDEAIKITVESAAQLSPAERKSVADKIRMRRHAGWRLFGPNRNRP